MVQYAEYQLFLLATMNKWLSHRSISLELVDTPKVSRGTHALIERKKVQKYPDRINKLNWNKHLISNFAKVFLY